VTGTLGIPHQGNLPRPLVLSAFRQGRDSGKDFCALLVSASQCGDFLGSKLTMARYSYATASIHSLRSSGYNPNQLTAEHHGQLVGEIERKGRLLKPIVCRDDGGQLVIIDGEHNWRAALHAGLTEVPVEVVEADDFQARRQTFKRKLSGALAQGQAGQDVRGDDGRAKAEQEGARLRAGHVRGHGPQLLLYAQAADLSAGRDNAPDGDAIAAMSVRDVRKLMAWLEGEGEGGEENTDQPRPPESPGAHPGPAEEGMEQGDQGRAGGVHHLDWHPGEH
jgi:hypothetical protein